ncbi:hypothetical protein RSOLAG22IIIB_11719 [Rhizoctonia solani]|uniref:DUF6535 domain-containing protein n=1 Tax=Rhizoctonia solani TaxID=456999 RepID=A0A0K6GAD4_9AGAM|nr:hypothetical protein RSOLAG22IIIB_11719 [Rhizoctonia solani]
MPLYLLVRPSPKRDAPQEFDEEGKELDADAQVWKTYVKEADQVDEEMVDGWNKSMDVILIFAALFSAISTAFVIESYKNLKPDPADASSQTLLIISQTLMLIANGSQPSSASMTSVSETTAFQASAKDICVNVLWFLSLSLSVAVSLISMLAKEWCLEFMSGRTGPPGPQACRRQQRWDGLVKWKMKEVILMLPSLIHISLLLFAIGLCVFLWDVHYGVAIPVVIVTTIAAGAYFACTIVPLLYQFCPYGTVLSRAIRQFKTRRSRITLTDWMDHDAISNALHWMITNCETPRSVDIALQSLAAGEDKKISPAKLEEVNAWAMIKQRFESTSVSKQSEQNRNIHLLYKRALEALPTTRRIDRDFYYSRDETRKLEQCSPQLIRRLSSSGLIRYLSDLASNNVANSRQIFATAQLWLWLNMSISELDRTHPTLTTLEEALLQYPELENKLENQEQVAEGLEAKLLEMLGKPSIDVDDEGRFTLGSPLERYAYRVIEIMLQKRSAPLPKNVSDGLGYVSEDLRGIESFKNLDTDALVTDPNIVSAADEQDVSSKQ